MTPRSHTLAYRIWAHCEPIGWDITNADLAKSLGEPAGRVNGVVMRKGWHHRLRGTFHMEQYYGLFVRSYAVPLTILSDLSIHAEMADDE